MKVNTAKIEQEMKRNGWSLKDFGKAMRPQRSKQAMWYLIRHAKGMRSIQAIATALKIDPKDLLR